MRPASTEILATTGKENGTKHRRRLPSVKVKRTSAASSKGTPPVPATGNGGDNSLLTLTEAAFRLGRVHRTTIMRWVKEGRLRCVRLSRKAILFEASEIDRFIREHRYSGE